MCSHPKFQEIREKLRKFLHGWRIYKVMKCDICTHEWEEQTDLMVYGRGKDEERYEIKKI
jgi:hypothetical protein